MSRALFLCVFALYASLPAAAVAENAASALPSVKPAPRAKISYPLNKRVGALRAGLLCMPNGGLRLGDFVEDDVKFGVMVNEVLAEAAGDRVAAEGSPVSIDLKNAKVKLCAKAWGVFGRGDTKSLSGDVSFGFDWTLASRRKPDSGSSTIAFTIPAKAALAPPMILKEALRRLLVAIEAQSR